MEQPISLAEAMDEPETGAMNAETDDLYVETSSHPIEDQTLQVYEPTKGWKGINWAEIWRYRELLYFLAWRDIKVRYKQTVLGAAWAIMQPIMSMVIFTVIFGRFAGMDHKTGGVPYPIYVYSAMLPWTFFANSVGNGGSSVVSSANLISKIYFPRLIIPLAAMGASLVDLAVSGVVLIGMMAYYGTSLSWQIALVPVLLLGTILTAIGVGALLAAFTVSYRDFRFVVPFLIQIWMYITPVMYPASIVPARFRWALVINPMAGLIGGFRAAFLATPLYWGQIAASLGIAVLFFIVGVSYFRHTEERFADVI